MRLISTLASAAVAAALLAGSVSSASAAIVCSGNVRWHTQESYPRDSGVTVHEDNWRWGPNEHFTFREPRGPWLLARRSLDGMVG